MWILLNKINKITIIGSPTRDNAQCLIFKACSNLSGITPGTPLNKFIIIYIIILYKKKLNKKLLILN